MLQSGPHMPHTVHGSLYHHNIQPPHGIVSHISSVNSTDQTENASVKSESRKHCRSESLHVNWTEDDVRRMAGEVYGETIADVHLSLLTYWILEDAKNYNTAKSFIRELAVDQGYNADREANAHLRRILKDTMSMRPKQAKAPVVVLSSRRVQKDPIVEQPEPNSSVSTPIKDYPPNTPDRPAPLSVRSRTSNNTPTAGCRSLSSPVTSCRSGIDDVFGIRLASASSLVPIAASEDTQSFLTVNTTISVTSPAQDYDATEEEDFYNTEYHPTSSKRSSLETASAVNIHNNQTLYSYGPSDSVSALDPQTPPRFAGQFPTGHGRLRIRVRSPPTNVPRFHQALPLRNYERNAHFYPTSRDQGTSDHNHAISAGSLLHNSKPGSAQSRYYQSLRPPLQLVDTHVRTSSTKAAQDTSPDQPQTAVRHGHSPTADELADTEDPDDRSSTSTYEIYQSTSLSEAINLADFPVPPMHNPVGELPMTTIRVLTHLDAAVTTGDLDTSSTTAAVATTYRTVAADIARLRTLLRQTRARGETLSSVDWQALSPFERAWREVNEDLLINIYGRQDTELNAQDVEYVDLIARELRESASARWVHAVFSEDVGIF